MLGGIAMSISGDHTLAPAHAHLNLVGRVTMALFGICYHPVPIAGAAGLARVHFTIGSRLTLASMLIFVATVLRRRS